MMLIIICFLPRVFSEEQNNNYVSRKSRSVSESFETGYVTSQGDDTAATYFNLDTDMYDGSISYLPTSSSNFVQTTTPYIHNERVILPIFDSRPLPKRNIAQMEKSSSKYSPGFLPSKIKTDAMYEHLKSAMHYKTPPQSGPMFGYESDYHADDDDVRTSSRGLHDSWPYHYYNPNEYDHMRIDVEKEKAKDKRYAVDAAKIIPVHEDLSDDTPYSQEPILTTSEYSYTSTDNPMSGHDPFFSVMLNDYFSKNYDYGDQLTLKGLDWGNNELQEQQVNRFRRLPSDNDNVTNGSIDSMKQHKYNDFVKDVNRNTETEKEMAIKNNFTKNKEANTEKANDHKKYQENEEKQMEFKDFVDSFANKFGSEDHMKDSKYILRSNKDKGENRKGFRRVYHKDEYQEDNEFYDNNNSSTIAEDNGRSKAHIGGSAGLLKSSSIANLGNHASVHDKSGDAKINKYKNHHSKYDDGNNHAKQFDRYRDIAKQAAQSNEADYVTH